MEPLNWIGLRGREIWVGVKVGASFRKLHQKHQYAVALDPEYWEILR